MLEDPQNTPTVSQLSATVPAPHLKAVGSFGNPLPALGKLQVDKLTPVLGEGQGVDDGLAQHSEEQPAAIGAPAPCLWDSVTPVTLPVGQCHPCHPSPHSQPREGTAAMGSPGISWEWRILNKDPKVSPGGDVCSAQ